MIAKIIVRGGNFDEALANAQKAVADYVCGGLKLNKDFLDRLLYHEELAKDGVHTTWVEDRKLHMPAKKASVAGAGVGDIFQVEAPFSGQVTEIKAQVGDHVEAGRPIVIL